MGRANDFELSSDLLELNDLEEGIDLSDISDLLDASDLTVERMKKTAKEIPILPTRKGFVWHVLGRSN